MARHLMSFAFGFGTSFYWVGRVGSLPREAAYPAGLRCSKDEKESMQFIYGVVLLRHLQKGRLLCRQTDIGILCRRRSGYL